MFESGTILALREPQSTKEEPYPYDKVCVVGQSPVQHATAGTSAFAGQDAVGYILRPAGKEFGPVIDRPFGEINELYRIESYPTDPTTGQELKPENFPPGMPSPEQVFSEAAKKEQDAAKKNQRPKAKVTQDNRRSPEQALRQAGDEPSAD